MRSNASRGSEQYHATNSVLAWSYVHWALAEVRLLSSAVFACSRSGSARTRLGGFFLRDLFFGLATASCSSQTPSPAFRPCGVYRGVRSTTAAPGET